MTMEKKRLQLIAENDARHKITVRYIHESKIYASKSVTKRSIFRRIFAQEKSAFDLDDSFTYPFETMRSQIRAEKLNADGKQSPVVAIEPKLVSLILCMSNIKRTLCLSQVLSLANDLIENTETQRRLIEWKLKKNLS